MINMKLIHHNWDHKMISRIERILCSREGDDEDSENRKWILIEFWLRRRSSFVVVPIEFVRQRRHSVAVVLFLRCINKQNLKFIAWSTKCDKRRAQAVKWRMKESKRKTRNTPQKKTNSKWQQVDWFDAIDENVSLFSCRWKFSHRSNNGQFVSGERM